MRIWSNDFEDKGPIPRRFTCDGDDVSPHLAWGGVPPQTQSLALIVDDPDAPVGTWVHWLVCDIPPNVGEVPVDTVPQGAREVTNNFGRAQYGGPCPPSGTHRYFHKLYALNVPRLEGADNISNFYRLVEAYMVDKTFVMGTYSRGR